MTGSTDGRDQSTGDPKQNFPVPGASQFPQPSYPFPIDTQLTMTSNYPVPQYQQQLEQAASSANTAGNGSLNNTPLNHSGASPSAATTDPAIMMSQPSNPHPPQFASPSTRTGGDESSERGQAPQTGDKRKRSKTSRACDECRRKKVRCDAPTEADGTPKTCSNCQKAGTSCEFEHKPLKRGPSRGYIRELSERVEQVELVQKQALRQSIDAGVAGVAFAPYAETTLPDAAGPAPNRTLSLTESRPFAPSEFQRDRIPSSGTWGLHSSPVSSFRPRERGSVAIAPDQTVPLSGSEGGQVFPTVNSEWPEPEPKRQRLELPANSQPLKMDPASLSRYYERVQPLFPLLPDSETVLEVISQAPYMSHAFGVAIQLLPGVHDEVALNGDLDNGPSNTSSETHDYRLTRKLLSDLFQTYTELAAYLAEQMKEDPNTRTNDENLACVWTLLLLALGSETDVRTLQKEPMTKTALLEHSLRTLAHLRSDRTFASAHDSPIDPAPFRQIVQQAYDCACVLTKYHALSVGTDPFKLAPFNDRLVIGQVDVTDYVSPEAAFIAESSKLISASQICLLAPNDGYGLDLAMFFIQNSIQPDFEQLVVRFAGLGEGNPIVLQVGNFIESLTARVKLSLLDYDIMKASAGMGAGILAEAAASSQNRRFNPLDMHVSALSVITLCEIVNSCSSAGMTTIANKYLNDAKEMLQKKSDAFHKAYGFEWFYAPRDVEARDQYQTNHWTDCLLRMIEWIQGKPPAVEKHHDSGNFVFPDFKLTAKDGWFHVLERF